jgi:DNA-directed RNA polymerase specialized sigma24 family protein
LKERHRQLSPRDGSASGLSRVPVDEDPGHAADRLMIGGLVRRAVQEVVERLEAAGQAPHGRAFVRYYLEEKDVAAIADELGKSAGQVKGMLRLARGRFKACFTDLLTRDGVPETRHEQELHAMFEVLDS